MTKRLSVIRMDIMALARPGGAAFVTILTLDTLARSTVSALVPLQAYELLGSAQQVSVLYFLTAVTGLMASLESMDPECAYSVMAGEVKGIAPIGHDAYISVIEARKASMKN